MAITIDGKKYKVLNNLGFQHGAGMYVKEVETNKGPQKAVREPSGSWRFWTIFDRIEPLTKVDLKTLIVTRTNEN